MCNKQRHNLLFNISEIVSEPINIYELITWFTYDFKCTSLYICISTMWLELKIGTLVICKEPTMILCFPPVENICLCLHLHVYIIIENHSLRQKFQSHPPDPRHTPHHSWDLGIEKCMHIIFYFKCKSQEKVRRENEKKKRVEPQKWNVYSQIFVHEWSNTHEKRCPCHAMQYHM